MSLDGIRGLVDQDFKRGMHDRGWRWLRTRRSRRVLAAVAATICLAMIVAAVLVGSDQGTRSMVVGVVGMVTLGWVGLLMGRSLRYVATAPTRLLDEQFRARRNAAHAVAWRILVACIAAVVLGLFLAVADQPDEALTLSYAQIYVGGAGLLFLALFLPSIVLAWTLPEESDPDD